jgi:hypothetical protein
MGIVFRVAALVAGSALLPACSGPGGEPVAPGGGGLTAAPTEPSVSGQPSVAEQPSGPAGPTAPERPSGSAQPSSSAAEEPLPISGCLFLAAGLQEVDGLQLGEFLVLEVQDGVVRGTGGALHSEWFEVRGAVSADGGHLEARDPYEPDIWRSLPLVWVPADRAFAGWQHVTVDELRAWSGGTLPLAGQPCG